MKVETRFDHTIIDEETGEILPHPRCVSKTQQGMTKECDINAIVKRFEQTGLINHVSKLPQMYGDFDIETDFQGCLDIVRTGQMLFDELPSAVRREFLNDAGRFFDWCLNEASSEELEKFGLMQRAEPPASEPSPRGGSETGGEALSASRPETKVTAEGGTGGATSDASGASNDAS